MKEGTEKSEAVNEMATEKYKKEIVEKIIENRVLVRARLDSVLPERSAEEGDVVRLVFGDLDEATADEGREASLLEGVLVVLVERAVVERVLEVFQSL